MSVSYTAGRFCKSEDVSNGDDRRSGTADHERENDSRGVLNRLGVDVVVATSISLFFSSDHFFLNFFVYFQIVKIVQVKETLTAT